MPTAICIVLLKAIVSLQVRRILKICVPLRGGLHGSNNLETEMFEQGSKTA